MKFKEGDWVRTKPMQVKSIDINNDIWVRDWDNKERRWFADELNFIPAPWTQDEIAYVAHTLAKDFRQNKQRKIKKGDKSLVDWDDMTSAQQEDSARPHLDTMNALIATGFEITRKQK